MLKINIASLKPGLYEMELEPEAAAVDLDPSVFSDIRVGVRMDRQEERIYVHLDASAIARLECDRTLVLFDQSIQGSYAMLFAPPNMVGEADRESDDIQVLNPGDAEIDLTEAARMTLLLAVPMRKVAPGADEAELKLSFGNEDNIDPRWDALRALSRSDDSE